VSKRLICTGIGEGQGNKLLLKCHVPDEGYATVMLQVERDELVQGSGIFPNCAKNHDEWFYTVLTQPVMNSYTTEEHISVDVGDTIELHNMKGNSVHTEGIEILLFGDS
jgi:hypothetical protein